MSIGLSATGGFAVPYFYCHFLIVCLSVSNFLHFSMTVDISVVNINEWLIMENISESLLTSKSQIYLWDKETGAFPFRVTIGYISYPDCFHLAYLHDNHVIKRAATWSITQPEGCRVFNSQLELNPNLLMISGWEPSGDISLSGFKVHQTSPFVMDRTSRQSNPHADRFTFQLTGVIYLVSHRPHIFHDPRVPEQNN